MFCSPYCLVVSLYPDKTEKKQVDRSSREEVTHTHLNPEGLGAPRKAEKTALRLVFSTLDNVMLKSAFFSTLVVIFADFHEIC